MAKLKRPIRKPKRSPGEQTSRDTIAKDMKRRKKSGYFKRSGDKFLPSPSDPTGKKGRLGRRLEVSRLRGAIKGARADFGIPKTSGTKISDKAFGKPPKSGSAKLKP